MKVCVLFQGNGIGDTICFLPALWQKKQEGHEIVIYENEFVKPIFDRMDIEFRDGFSIQGKIGTYEKLEKEFDKIYAIQGLCSAAHDAVVSSRLAGNK